jgi:hypothetical protein
MGFEVITAHFIKQRGGDLAACTVLRTNEEDFLFHDLVIRLSLVAETVAGSQQFSRSRVSFLTSRANIGSDCTQSCRHLKFVSNSCERFLGNA